MSGDERESECRDTASADGERARREHPGSTDGSRTIVLGFDALDFRYLDRYRDSLPNFTRLREVGVEAELRSTFPPWTGSAWPSMYTGTDPSHHGVYGFVKYDGYPDEAELVTRLDVQAPALWNYLTSEGIPSIVLNVPVTHPAEPIDGVLVPGYQAMEDEPGHPADIRRELSNALGEPYRIYSRAELSNDDDEKFAGYLELLDLRTRAAVELLSNREWQLAMVQVQKTDAVFHNFDDDRCFRGVYEAADELVGAVLEAVEEPVNVVVCSDHGIGSVRGYRIFVNEVLRRHGYVEQTDEDTRLSFASEKSTLVNPETADDPVTGSNATVLQSAVKTLDRFGVTPSHVYTTAKYLGIAPLLRNVVPASVSKRVLSKGVDWRASVAYCRDRTRLGVRINLEGREPSGVVPPEEYEQVRTAIVDLLSDLTTPDGRPAFEFVVRREEFYDGPLIEEAPDVLVCPRGMDNVLSPTLYGRTFLPEEKYDHKRDGVFIGAGPAFRDDAAIDRCSLADVAPIVMAALGLAVPSRMTGRVPDSLLSVPVRVDDYGVVTYGTGDVWDERSDEAARARLEDLGYL